MATYTQTPAGTIKAEVRVKGYKRRTKTFPNKTIAKKWVLETEKKMKFGTYVDDRNSASMTIAQLIDTYINLFAEKHSDPKLEKARGKLFKEAFGERYVNDFSRSDVIDWIRKRSEKVVEATLVRQLQTLKGALEYGRLEKDLFIKGQPVTEAIKYCKNRNVFKTSQAKETRASDAEIQKIIDSSTSEGLSDIVWFAVQTAMRRGEIFNLEWRHVDINNNCLRLRARDSVICESEVNNRETNARHFR